MENGSGRAEDTRRKIDGRGGYTERERDRERQSGDTRWERREIRYKEGEGWNLRRQGGGELEVEDTGRERKECGGIQ